MSSGTSRALSGPQLAFLLNGSRDECHSTIFVTDIGLEKGQGWVGRRDDSSKSQVSVKCANIDDRLVDTGGEGEGGTN